MKTLLLSFCSDLMPSSAALSLTTTAAWAAPSPEMTIVPFSALNDAEGEYMAALRTMASSCACLISYEGSVTGPETRLISVSRDGVLRMYTLAPFLSAS